jgi:ABC-type glycerol-3-phosphate transport system permease component
MNPTVSRSGRDVAATVLLVAVAIVAIGPLITLALAALKSNGELAVNPLGLPRQWLFSNFADAFVNAHMSDFLWNSVGVVVPTLVIVLSFASMAGYALATFEFPGKQLMLLICLVGLVIPIISIVVPMFYLLQAVDLVDSRVGLIMCESAQALPIAIFVMRAAFMDLPRDMREAALLDGANEFQTFVSVMLPLVTSGLASAAVLTFLSTWNDFLLPLVLISSKQLLTLPLGLSYLQGRYVTDVPLLAAATLITAVPSITIYLLLQKQFALGVVQGAFK